MKKIIYLIGLTLLPMISNAQSNFINWEKSFGGSMNDGGAYVEQTIDGGFIIGGYAYSDDGDVNGHHGYTSEADGWIVRLNSYGDTLWTRSLGGTKNDFISQVKQTPDGGFIVVAYSKSDDGDVTLHHGSQWYYDAWIVKLGSSGNIEWERSYGGTSDDYGISIDLSDDGGYIVGAASSSTDDDVWGNIGGMDCWVLKLNSTGDTIWTKNYGGTSSEYIESIMATNDGGYVFAGESNSSNGDVTSNNGASDYWIVKLDSLGNIQWKGSYGGSWYDEIRSLEQTSDGGYIAAGFTASFDFDVTGNHGGYDYWIAKFDSTGDTLWTKTFGGTNDDLAYSIKQTCDQGFIIAGYSYSDDGDITDHHGSTSYTDSWLVKIDNQGNLEWSQSLGGTDMDEGSSIIQTPDGQYVIACYSKSSDGDVTDNNGGYDLWIVNMASNRVTPEICLVTVDSATGKNLIVWEETAFPAVSYNIYKEGYIADVYDYIGTVSFDTLSIFIDAASNPAQKCNRYKISTIDSCGNESLLSTEHKTMHLNANLSVNKDFVNLIWENYEGLSFSTYHIYKGTSSVTMDSIDAVPNNIFSYTDSITMDTAALHYSIVVVHPTGCTATIKAKNYNSSKSNTQSIAGLEALSASATTTNATSGNCDGTAIVTANGGTSPYTYLWDDPASQTTSTATGLCGNTTYTVAVTDAGGDATSTTVFIGETTGITPQSLIRNPQLIVYPNPSRGVFTLQIIDSQFAICDYIIYDVLGREIIKSKILNHISEIDMSAYPTGIYNLLIITEERIVNKRIVIE
ncbi:MAG: T9SS type A sorting domain-containing protein [Bacteroidota bacterium]